MLIRRELSLGGAYKASGDAYFLLVYTRRLLQENTASKMILKDFSALFPLHPGPLRIDRGEAILMVRAH